MYRPVVILFSCLLIFGCNQKEVDHPADHVFHASGLIPGEVMVGFNEGTTLPEARQFISDLGLSMQHDPMGPLLLTTVSVPVDSEDQWVKRLLTYPIVRSAGRGVQSEPSYYVDPRDSLRSKSGQRNVPRKDKTFKLLPKFHPGKDTAGFQFIPRQFGAGEEGGVVIEHDIEVVPYDKAPQIAKKVEPAYPERAKRVGLEGNVVLEITVDEGGKIKQIAVLKSDAEIFTKPAIEAAEQFVLAPAYSGNSPVVARMTHEFQFRLPKKK